MPTLRPTALVLLLGLEVAAPASAEPVWGPDKAQHLLVSLGLGGGSYVGLRLLGDDPPALRLALSVGLALAPGLAKEIYDAGQPGNHFSGADLGWDVAGALTGALLALGIELLIDHLRHRRAALSTSRTGAAP